MSSEDTNLPSPGGKSKVTAVDRAFVDQLRGAASSSTGSGGHTPPPFDRDAVIAGLLDRLTRAKIDPRVVRSEMRRLDTARKALKNRVGALVESTSAEITGEVDAFELDVAAQKLHADAMVAATDAVQQTRAAFNAVQAQLTANLLASLSLAVSDLETQVVPTAKTSALKTTKDDADGLRAILTDAGQFGDDLEAWVKEKLVFVTYSNKAKGDPAIEVAFNRIRAEAEALADAMKFDEARAKLASFDALPGVAGTDFDKATAYAKALLTFQNTHMKGWDKLIDKDIGGSKAWEQEYIDLKAKAAADNFDGAISDLAEITTRTIEMTQAFDKRTEYLNLRGKGLPEVDNAIQAMEDQVALRDGAAALAAISALDTSADPSLQAKAEIETLREHANTSPDVNEFVKEMLKSAIKQAETDLVVSKKIRTSHDKAKATLEFHSSKKPPIAEDVQGAQAKFDEAKRALDDATAKSFVDARKSMKDATDGTQAAIDFDTKLTEVLTIMGKSKDVKDAFNLKKLKLDTKSVGKLNTPSKIAKAMKALDKLHQDVLDLDAYLTLRATVTRIKGTLPAPSEALTLCQTALDDADAVKDKPRDAAAILDRFLTDGNYEKILADISAFNALKARVDKATKRTLTFVGKIEGTARKALEDKLNTSFSDAVALADASHEYEAAIAALNTHSGLLQPVQGFAATYGKVLYVIKALEKKNGPLDASVAVSLAAAETKAATDVARAEADLETLLASLSATAVQVSRDMETEDSRDSNAGHSLARHGVPPDVTDDKLKRRLLTGIAPDGVASTCTASSAFDSIEDWLAGREMAMEQAEAEGMKPGATKLKPNEDEYYSIDVDHGRPIDKAFIGVKPNIEADPDGTVKQGRTYETFIETSGITKARVTFVFQFDKPDSGSENVRDRDDFVKRFNAENGADPTDDQYTGRWVMMQQYPLVDGWNPVTQSYDE